MIGLIDLQIGELINLNHNHYMKFNGGKNYTMNKKIIR